jgi:hypothetical protein
MPVFSRRKRILSIRLSETEYQVLKEICVREEARSLSDLARTAVQTLIASRTRPRGEGLETALQSLVLRLDAIERTLREALWNTRPDKGRATGQEGKPG